MKKRTLTPEQTAARDARRAAFRELARKVSKMTEDQRQAMIRSMPAIVTIEGRPLSGVNSILLSFQCPGATIVGGFRQWIKAGRCVKKGEHGACIWVPGGAKGSAPADGEAGESIRFLTGTVFDVTQTAELGAAAPVAIVSPEIADAFGLRDLPNTRIAPEETEAEETERLKPGPNAGEFNFGGFINNPVNP